MRDLDVLLCGSLWVNAGHEEAGWELVRFLQSVDTGICRIASEFLAEAGMRSVALLQAAVAAGTLSGTVAADCMAKSLSGSQKDAACGLSQLSGYSC